MNNEEYDFENLCKTVLSRQCGWSFGAMNLSGEELIDADNMTGRVFEIKRRDFEVYSTPPGPHLRRKYIFLELFPRKFEI